MPPTPTRPSRRRCDGWVPETAWAWRFAIPADAPALVPLVRAAYRGDAGWTSEAHLVEGLRIDLAALRGLITGPRALMLVVHEGAIPIAC